MAQPRPTGPTIPSREEYRRWLNTQPRGRYERVEGEVVAMAPERVAHAEIKAAAWQALQRAIAAAGVPCHALPDGVTVEIGDGTDYEPDASVYYGERAPPDAIAVPDPVVVVEVLSPSTRSTDTGAKLADYFRVPSIQHYVIVRADRRALVHHRRLPDGDILTRLAVEGAGALDPPGSVLDVADLYPREAS